MKSIVVIWFAVIVSFHSQAQSQSRYFTKTGTISFNAGTSMEDIDATNRSVTSVIDASTGQIEFAVLIKGFEFKRGLMQEHFNENYMESEKYPKSIFKGKIEDVSKVNFTKDGKYPVKITGTLDLHNVKKETTAQGTFTITGGSISGEGNFTVTLEDFAIKIPGAVKDKVSTTATIQVKCSYKPL
jgi:polyisoprenoid-binding protein YceI